MKKVTCQTCGKKFVPNYKEQRFCSNYCAMNSLKTSKCEWCGKIYVGHRNSRYCCEEHMRLSRTKNQAERRARKREEREMKKNKDKVFKEYTKAETYAERQVRETLEKSDMELRKRHYEWKLKHDLLT